MEPKNENFQEKHSNPHGFSKINLPSLRPETIELNRNSCSLVLANLITEKYPNAQVGEFGFTEEGFYVDVHFPDGFSSDDLPQLQKLMRESLQKRPEISEFNLERSEAANRFADSNQAFMSRLVESENSNQVRVAQVSDQVFYVGDKLLNSKVDFNPKGIKADTLGGAYFQKDKNEEMLTRIKFLGFPNAEALKEFELDRQERIARDHRKIGKEQDLFTTSSAVGKGLPMLTGKGGAIRRTLERFIVDEELKRGYEHVNTPALGRKGLYETSGHWEHYQDSMFPPMEVGGEELLLRPMTCPHHFMLFDDAPRSYRELPKRIAEISPLYRKELSGELSGLVRILEFHLADAHIFIEPEDLKREFADVVRLIEHVTESLGIKDQCFYRVSLKDDAKEKYADNPVGWALAEDALVDICKDLNLDFVVEKGHAAFYGPKLDVQMRTVHGNDETLFTNQIDMVLPERFELNYTDRDGSKKTPWVIHRSSLGCVERTMAFLIEHYGGKMPTWLSPVQARVMTVTEETCDYARELRDKLLQLGLRVEVDESSERIGKKVRQASLDKVPYQVVVGRVEAENGQVAVTNRDTGEKANISSDEFVNRLLREDATRSGKLGVV